MFEEFVILNLRSVLSHLRSEGNRVALRFLAIGPLFFFAKTTPESQARLQFHGSGATEPSLNLLSKNAALFDAAAVAYLHVEV